MTRSEFEFIDILRRRFGAAIGDDAAVFQSGAGKETVVTTDLLIEDIDFRRTTAPALLLGHKSLAVSLSDIAAMGARPRWSLISIGVPDDVWQTEFVDQFYEGLASLALRYDVQLIGGDTSRTSEKLVIDSIVLGECKAGHAVKRAGAQPGDQIFVTGSLGGAAAGLRLIERGAHLAEQNLADDDSVGAAIEYGVGHLGIDDIVVCGHTGCGGIAALLEPIPPDREAHLGRWVEFTKPAHQLIAAARVPEEERLTATIKAHVQFQIDNLMTYPIVREGVLEGRLNIHGWLYDMEHGTLSAYDPKDGEWHNLLDMVGA